VSDAVPHDSVPEQCRAGLAAANKAPRCGARNRQGTPCQMAALRGRRRCYLHGGKSTGSRTVEGRRAQRRAHLAHGERSGVWRQVRELEHACAEALEASVWQPPATAQHAHGEVMTAYTAIDRVLDQLREDLGEVAVRRRDGPREAG